MEAFWLSMGAVLMIVVLYMIFTGGFYKNATYLVFPLICLAMWGARRFMRRRMEKHQQWLNENANENKNT